jgi:hypothetical protein
VVLAVNPSAQRNALADNGIVTITNNDNVKVATPAPGEVWQAQVDRYFIDPAATPALAESWLTGGAE